MLKAKDIMLYNPPFLYVNNKVSHARVIFTHSKLKSIPVLNKNGSFAGILEKKVISQEHLPVESKVVNYLNTSVKPLYEDESISILAKIKLEQRTYVLPVISRDGSLVGLVPEPEFIKDILGDITRYSESVYAIDNKDLAMYGIILINDDGEIICFNRNAENILGLKGKNIYGIHINKVIHDSKLCEVVKKGQTHLKAKMQANRVILCSNRFPLYKGDEVAGAMGIFEDISKLEHLNENLKSLRGLNLEMVGVLESINDGIILIDNNGVIIRTNSAFEMISGFSANEILGVSYDYLIDKGCLPSTIFWQVMEKKQTLNIIENIKGRDFLIIGKPIFEADGKLMRVVIIIKDIYHLNELILNIQMTQELATRYCKDVNKRQDHEGKDDMVASSMAMRRVVSLANKVAKVDSNVLIMGDTGVGKEVVARSIHRCSRRMDGPFIKLNCGAIPENLLESELFGYEPGAFTGAKREGKPGLVEMADGGTLFLDEVADLPMNLQVKLLRVLQEREFMRIGGTKTKKVDFRLIAATNKDLENMVKQNSFREDLFYRLNVVPVVIPPLRERKEDIVPLIIFFLNKFNKKYGLIKKISPEVIQNLLKYDWPGNIRELENAVERLVVTSDSNLIMPEDMRENTRITEGKEKGNEPKALADVLEKTEKDLICRALEHCRTTREMADILGISQSAVVKKMKKYGIKNGSEARLSR